MRLIPVAELFAGAVIGLVVLGLRTLWGSRRISSARGPEIARERREQGMTSERRRAQLIASCIGLAVVSLPLILRLVPPNVVYGFRVAATQSSPAIWYPANAFMGSALLVAAVISASVLAVLPVTANRWVLVATFVVPVFVAIAASFVYLNRLMPRI
jgi:hypothetical protein